MNFMFPVPDASVPAKEIYIYKRNALEFLYLLLRAYEFHSRLEFTPPNYTIGQESINNLTADQWQAGKRQ